jgi:hypothetical protein
MRVAAFFLLLTLLATPLPVRAVDVPRAARGEGSCAVSADPQWAPQEQFVWKRVCLGEAANFNVEPGYGGDLDPKGLTGLPESRVLRSSFLATILLADKYRHAITGHGVHIVGARFTEPVDLRHAELSTDLSLDRSVLEKGADLRGLRSTRTVILDGSKITGPLKMSDLELHGDLSLSTADLAAVNLNFARVGGVVSLGGSTVAEKLDMVGLQVGGNLFLDDNGKFTLVDLTSAHVGSLSLNGSQVTGLLNLAEVQVEHDVAMYQAEFADVLIGLAHIQGHLFLASSKVTGDLTMVGLRVDGNLMGLKVDLNRVSLTYAEVGGALSFIGATVTGDLEMTGLRVGRDLLLSSISEKQLIASLPESLKGSLDVMGLKVDAQSSALVKASFGKVVLTGGKVEGGLSLVGSTLNGDLLMDGAQIDADLTMTDGAFKAVSLERARIGGVLNGRGSTFGGSFDCNNAEIRSRLDLGGAAQFAGSVNCSFAEIGKLDLAGGSFQSNLDLTGTHIKSELVIGSVGAHTAWVPQQSVLYLRNATADAIEDAPDAWPTQIDLSGFAYRNLGGRNATQQDSKADRPDSWFVDWLGRQQPYASAPYAQLAGVLRNTGKSGTADEILYAGKERERAQEASLPWRAWLTTIRALIGYGYHIEWALYWVAGFVVAGIAVLWFSGEGRRNRMPFGIVYSFDMLLPIIRLREQHYQIDLQGWARYYFYVHKIMGHVLASFLIAGIAGLTK